jgi:hypothetical protein
MGIHAWQGAFLYYVNRNHFAGFSGTLPSLALGIMAHVNQEEGKVI